MADTGIFCSGSHLIQKAGSGASVIATAEAYTNRFMQYSESYINTATRKNWSDAISTLNEDVKYILADASSSMGAMLIINYDMSGYLSKDEARAKLNLLRDSFIRDVELLKLQETKDFVTGA